MPQQSSSGDKICLPPKPFDIKWIIPVPINQPKKGLISADPIPNIIFNDWFDINSHGGCTFSKTIIIFIRRYLRYNRAYNCEYSYNYHSFSNHRMLWYALHGFFRVFHCFDQFFYEVHYIPLWLHCFKIHSQLRGCISQVIYTDASYKDMKW